MNPAANYRAAETVGTMTPDEIRQRRVVGLAPDVFEAVQDFGFDGPESSFAFEGCQIRMPDGSVGMMHGWLQNSEEETVILSFSRLRSKALMRELGKIAIVRIFDPELLLEVISKQIGVQGRCEHINYTKTGNRSHSIKGWPDRHMAEVRLVWTITPCEVRWVEVPSGIAEGVDLALVPEFDSQEPELDLCAYDRFLARRGPFFSPVAIPREPSPVDIRRTNNAEVRRSRRALRRREIARRSLQQEHQVPPG